MADLQNEALRGTALALCGAVEHIATDRGLDPAHISAAAILAAFELTSRTAGAVQAIERLRDFADLAEGLLLNQPKVARC